MGISGQRTVYLTQALRQNHDRQEQVYLVLGTRKGLVWLEHGGWRASGRLVGNEWGGKAWGGGGTAWGLEGHCEGFAGFHSECRGSHEGLGIEESPAVTWGQQVHLAMGGRRGDQ